MHTLNSTMKFWSTSLFLLNRTLKLSVKTIFKGKTIFAIVFLCLFIVSCTDKDTIGLNEQPGSDELNVLFSDTSTVIAFSKVEDSVRTDETAYNILGSYLDPEFGKTTASIYTQYRISTNNLNFGITPTLDSLVLSLAYRGYYGDTTTIQNVKVYELSDNLALDQSYYSNKVLSGTLVGSKTFSPHPRDSVKILGKKYAPHLRIKLNASLAQKFFNASGQATLADNNAFLDFFKGLKIESQAVNTGGALMMFDLTSSLSRMTLFYKNNSGTGGALNDSLQFNFVVNEYCARFNNFNHYNYVHASTEFKQHVFPFISDTLTSGTKNLFLQAMAGVKVKLFFPYIKNFVTNNQVAINKAELIMNVNDLGLSTIPLVPAARMALVKNNANGINTFVLDQFEGDTHFGGIYNSTTKQYKFNITRYIQGILNNTITNEGLYLMVSGAAIYTNRVILKGTDINNPGRFKLKLTYTKI